MMIPRRQSFGRSALKAGTVVGFPHLGKSAAMLLSTPGQKPGRIIHMVVDGMSLGALTCADYLSHLVRGRGLTWMELFQRPATRRGLDGDG